MLCPESAPTAVAALAAAIAEGRSDDELALLSALFVQLGDSLTTILAARALSQGCGGPAARRSGPTKP